MADKEIDELTAASAGDGTELFHGVQGGNSRKFTGDGILRANVASVAGLTLAQGDILYATGVGTVTKLAKGTAGQTLRINSGATAPEWVDNIGIQSALATTSGTSVSQSSIPDGVKRITIAFDGVSTSGTSVPIIQLGDSGGIEATNYTGGSLSLAQINVVENTVGFSFFSNQTVAASIFHGSLTLSLVDDSANTWCYTSCVVDTASSLKVCVGAGTKSLSGTLTQFRLTTTGGSNTFDAGSLKFNWEF